MSDLSRLNSCKTLSELLPGQTFTVLKLGQSIDASVSASKKINADMNTDMELLLYRLEQLGFRPGNRGICLYENIGKGSLAYRIQGSVIALRVEDAELIQVSCSEEAEVCVMLAGNPNVGKSTVFNRLTGMHQHTGNWPGKTVELAEGTYRYASHLYADHGKKYRIIDLPGTYSLTARSEEEAVTTEALQSGKANVVVVVCDASGLERSLRFALEVKELCSKEVKKRCNEQVKDTGEAQREEAVPVILCVNLCDEAEKKGIQIDFKLLEQLTECKVIAASAAQGKGLEKLKQAIAEAGSGSVIEAGNCDCDIGETNAWKKNGWQENDWQENGWQENDWQENDWQENNRNLRRVNLINACEVKTDDIKGAAGDHESVILKRKEKTAKTVQKKNTVTAEERRNTAERADFIMKQTVQIKDQTYWHKDYRIDRFLTSPVTGSICMLGMLFALFWLTINGANYPSELLFSFFGWVGNGMDTFLTEISCPLLLKSLWLDGIWRVSSWVVSVMLPPMAIFFPLFTILEDLGYLPRVAFHLDGCFKRCHACGKQALTMCMGLGCNAVGVTGCRIIDTEKERLLAVLTNSLIPCNGRFPALIALITMFFAGGSAGAGGMIMCLAILLAVGMTFLVTRLLAVVLNKGKSSTFILELPPYRKPQFGQILIRSLVDRTLFVLSRAILAAAPAGLMIWLLANIQVFQVSLLQLFISWLEYPASLIGLDGAILFAFILGFPANEIVLPALLMCYMSEGSLVEVPALEQLKLILINNGWTMETALCMFLFTLFHWPCATTCMTIQKETGSWKWTMAAFLVPMICGCVLCGLVHMVYGFMM